MSGTACRRAADAATGQKSTCPNVSQCVSQPVLDAIDAESKILIVAQLKSH
jgi:hypothetical protein